MRAVFDRKAEAASHIYTFWFKPERPVRYLAGQFTQIRLPIGQPDNRGAKRWFTLSSSPTEDMLAITTRIDPNQQSAFKKVLFSLRPGTEVSMAEPMGDFVLPKNRHIPIIFIAGGIGITPMRSMIKWLEDSGEKRDIQLYYATRTLDDVAFDELFGSARIKYEPVLSHPPAGWEGLAGHLSARKLLGAARAQNKSLFYISGPQRLAADLYKQLVANDIASHRLVTDFFPGYENYDI